MHTVEVLTDHNNLMAFQNIKSLNGRQARWAIALSGYDFTIAHQPVKRNPADVPLRRPDYAPSIDEVNEQAGQLFPTLQRKLAQIGPTPLSGEAARWVKETSQDLHKLHKPVVDARENPRPSLIVAELYGDYAESKEEGGLPSGAEGSNNSYEEAPPSQSHKVHSEDLATSLGRQRVPRGVVHSYAITVDNAQRERDLETKSLKDLIAILQKGDPFVQHKCEAMQKRATRKKDRELDCGFTPVAFCHSL
jgi:hypothetical protein